MKVVRSSVVLASMLLLTLLSFDLHNTHAGAPLRTIHGQIVFSSNEALASYASSGSGTETDPYIIEDLQIIDPYDIALDVTGTDVHIILRNIAITGNGTHGNIYLTGVSNATIERCHLIDAGIDVFTLRNIRIINNDITDGEIVIGSGWVGDLGWSGNTNISVVGNTISGSSYSAISLYDAENVTIHGNVIRECGSVGIGLSGSEDVLVSDNQLIGNNGGLGAFECRGITLAANQIENSSFAGIRLDLSHDVLVHHNNFINNTYQLLDDGQKDGIELSIEYPYGGNYWSNDTGDDLFSGPAQNLSGPDGICDTPFNVTPKMTDRYPLSSPFARSNATEPPFASVIIRPAYGRPDKAFTLDASRTWDSEDAAFDLKYRWDWDNDGVWDTPWSSKMTVTYLYVGPGNATIGMMARDSDGLTDTTTRLLVVDRHAPVLKTDFEPGKVIFTERESIWINWTCEEELSGLANMADDFHSTEYFEVLVNGIDLRDPGCPIDGYMGFQSSDGYNATSNISILPSHDGDYDILIRAADQAGNVAELRIHFEIHTSSFDIQGPNGPWPLMAVIAGVSIAIVVIVFMILRSRRRKPEPLGTPEDGNVKMVDERA